MNQTPGDPEQIKKVGIIRNFTKPFWLPVNGGSMRPLLRDGDLVRVIPVKCHNNLCLNQGKIVLIARESAPGLVVHRIVGIGDKWLFEQGDNARTVWAFDRTNLIGVVTHRRRNGKVKSISFSVLWALSSFLQKIGIRK